MKQFFLIALMLFGMGTRAQSLADKELERIVCGKLAEEISTLPEEALRYAGVAVMEVATGNLVADVSLFYKDGDFIRNPHGNTQYVPSGLLTGYGTSWQSHDILGHSALMSLLQQVCWCNAVAGGKFIIRKDVQDDVLPFDSISNKEGLDSLRSAMRECVTDGLGRRMNSEFVSVAAMTNVSKKDADGYKGQFAAAFFPYEKPEYTIGVYIWRNWGKGYANPSDVARHIIDWIACNRLSLPPYLSLTEPQNIKHRDGWVHPAAR